LRLDKLFCGLFFAVCVNPLFVLSSKEYLGSLNKYAPIASMIQIMANRWGPQLTVLIKMLIPFLFLIIYVKF
jgi:hypothetical protein